MESGMTYKGSGVDYDAMDPFKKLCQLAGRQTSANIERFGGISELEMSRGESAFLIETGDGFLAHVEEGLGTKNLVADAMNHLTGKTYYDQIAQDTVAMIVNDLITLGALPLSVAMHLAVASGDWFSHEQRCQDLIDGWKHACDLARCVWGGGETPTLKGIVVPGTALLSGSAIGIISPKERLINPANIQDGDQIIFLTSSGIHANGLTLARQIADKLPQGYLTKVGSGLRTYGETLLDPTHIYVGFVEDCLESGINIHYCVNITGHGWRKLMRSTTPFSYVIETLPPPLPIFDFIQKHGQISDEEAHGNLNMGAGFALYVSKDDVEKVLHVADQKDYFGRFHALRAGYIQDTSRKEVVIEPKGIVFEGKTLAVR